MTQYGTIKFYSRKYYDRAIMMLDTLSVYIRLIKIQQWIRTDKISEGGGRALSPSLVNI